MHFSLRPFLNLLVISGLLAVSGCAHPSSEKSQAYFAADSISPTLISTPPKEQSIFWNGEISDIIAKQRNPDPEQVKQALREHDVKIELVAEAAGPELTRANYPAVFALMDRVSATSKGSNDFVKSYWNTRRPYLVDPRVKALIPAHSNASYPSGHTCGAYTWAHVLGQLLPAYREVFYARAEEIAQHRVLVGMHFPHDLEGGRQLALLIVGGLEQTPAYKKDVALAKRELADYEKMHTPVAARLISPPDDRVQHQAAY